MENPAPKPGNSPKKKEGLASQLVRTLELPKTRIFLHSTNTFKEGKLIWNYEPVQVNNLGFQTRIREIDEIMSRIENSKFVQLEAVGLSEEHSMRVILRSPWYGITEVWKQIHDE